jgi:hypothetical protein
VNNGKLNLISGPFGAKEEKRNEVSSLKDVENPMILDKLWKEKEQGPKVIGECSGCEEDIYEGEDIYAFQMSFYSKVLIHQNSECCLQYVANMSVCKIAGQE